MGIEWESERNQKGIEWESTGRVQRAFWVKTSLREGLKGVGETCERGVQ